MSPVALFNCWAPKTCFNLWLFDIISAQSSITEVQADWRDLREIEINLSFLSDLSVSAYTTRVGWTSTFQRQVLETSNVFLVISLINTKLSFHCNLLTSGFHRCFLFVLRTLSFSPHSVQQYTLTNLLYRSASDTIAGCQRVNINLRGSVQTTYKKSWLPSMAWSPLRSVLFVKAMRYLPPQLLP